VARAVHPAVTGKEASLIFFMEQMISFWRAVLCLPWWWAEPETGAAVEILGWTGVDKGRWDGTKGAPTADGRAVVGRAGWTFGLFELADTSRRHCCYFDTRGQHSGGEKDPAVGLAFLSKGREAEPGNDEKRRLGSTPQRF